MRYPHYKIYLAFLDYCILILSFSIATNWVIQLNDIHMAEAGPVIFRPDTIFVGLYSLFMIFIFQWYNLYKIDVVYNRSQQLIFILRSFLQCVIWLETIAFFIRYPEILLLRETVVFMCVIGGMNIAVIRIVFLPLILKYFYNQSYLQRNLIVIGSDAEVKKVAIQLELGNIYGLNLVGFVMNDADIGEAIFKDKCNLGTVDDIPRLVQESLIDEILISSSKTGFDDLFKTLDICKRSNAHVVVSSDLLDIINNKVFTDKYYDIPVVRLESRENDKLMFGIKRIMDVVGALLGIILFSPVFITLTIAIKLTSKGPFLYKQIRVGKDGREFEFYKFRSMYDGSDNCKGREQAFHNYIRQKERKNGVTKIVDESNITSIGKFLRKTSLDELPQLFNVLKGDMSLVGPRPCLPYEWHSYDEWHKRRLSVLPGCTGLWQVLSRAKGSFEDMVLLDIYYINNMSPWFDLQLILKTIPVMVFGRGGK